MDYLDKLTCGDVLEVMRQIPDNTVHLAITSPPYNVGISYDNHNDRLSYDNYLEWMKKVWLETKRILVPGGRFALNIAPTSIKNFRPIHHDFSNQLRDIGMIMRTEIIWYKQTMGRRTAWGSWKSPSNPHIIPSWEYVLVFCKDSWNLEGNSADADITKDEFMRFSDGIWYIPPESQRRGHPTPFPEELIYRLIKFYSYKGNIVLDMFGGTGTVAVMAQKIGRHYIHIDISQKYCQIAQQRLDTARMLAEIPLQVGRLGHKLKLTKRSTKPSPKTTVNPEPVYQGRIMEKRTSYKDKKSKSKQAGSSRLSTSKSTSKSKRQDGSTQR